MTVRLDGKLEKHSSAGILYRARRKEQTFSAFVLGAGHSVSIVRSSGQQVTIESTWNLKGLKDGDPVRLTVEGDGPGLGLYVNDKPVTEDREAALEGNPGAYAMGTGCFIFDDVTVELPASTKP
jgi:hypothetical protein